MTFSFSKSNRLLKKKDFIRVLSSKKKLIGKNLVINILLTSKQSKLGLTVTSSFGKSNERNLFKRRAREAFRTILPKFPKNFEIIIYPKKRAKTLEAFEIKDEILSLISSYEKNTSNNSSS